MSEEALRGRTWRRLASGLYCWSGWREDPLELLIGWHRRLPSAVFAGRTAAWLHGLEVQGTQPVEVAVCLHSGIRSRRGLIVRHSDVAVSRAETVRGLPATSMRDTLVDVCRRLREIDALCVLDAALRRGFDRLDSRLGQLAQPAESPMETRLRWVLLEGGLPAPQVQANLFSPTGTFVGRADLYYPARRLVIEFDGGNHRERLIEDNRRQNAIVEAGYRVLRFTSADVMQRPDAVRVLVRGALA